MECPICFEANSLYRLRGCSHSVCKTCAAAMAEQSKHQIHPFGEYVHFQEMTFARLECPLCRAQEPNPISPETRIQLNEAYPDAYRIWFETTLFEGEDGTWCYTSRRKGNIRLLPLYDDDIYTLLERIEMGVRTTSCWIDNENIYNDPNIFLQWSPVNYTYPYASPYINIIS